MRPRVKIANHNPWYDKMHNPLGLLKKRTSFLEDQRKECLIFFHSISKQGTKVYTYKYIYIFFFGGGGGGGGGGG